MKYIRVLTIAWSCFLLNGCADSLYEAILSTTVSHERARPATTNAVLPNQVTAKGENWQMNVSWGEHASALRIWFRSGIIEDQFSINLIPRAASGFTSGTEKTGIMTRRGYYQPAGYRKHIDTKAVVLVDYGTMDFASIRDMQLTLGTGYWSRDSIRALGSSGMLVICDIKDQAWNIEIQRLTLHGRPIPEKLLKPYFKGQVKINDL